MAAADPEHSPIPIRPSSVLTCTMVRVMPNAQPQDQPQARSVGTLTGVATIDVIFTGSFPDTEGAFDYRSLRDASTD